MKDKYEILEFNIIKEKVKKYARTSMGKYLIDNLSMLNDYIEVKEALFLKLKIFIISLETLN